jgi:DNA-binding NtrC family response regulator
MWSYESELNDAATRCTLRPVGDKVPVTGFADASAPSVLVVDDDSRLARALGRALTHLGLDVTITEDGHSALHRLEQRRFDVLVLDLRMPGMDGIDVLRRASSHPNFPPTILHSAYLDVPTAVEAMRAGATEVLQKPVVAADLARKIRELSAIHAERHAEVSGERGERSSVHVRSDLTSPLLGDSHAMHELREAVRRVARFKDVAVLIEGPTGTGKELVAQSIRQLSTPDEPLVCVNCAAIPAELFESELFGHEAGAFTSARGVRAGLLEEAGNGILFLDEVGELPAALQPKLLRVLETRELRRVGSNRTRRFNARVVSATNRPLSEEFGDTFRSDLYFRISGHTIRTPALRDHVSDIVMLAAHFCYSFCTQNNLPVLSITDDAIEALCAFDWPGNVRQLRRVIESAVVHAPSDGIQRQEIETVLRRYSGSRAVSAEIPVRRSLPDLERDMIVGAYKQAEQNLSEAARELGIPRTTLRDRLKRYGMR